MQHAYKLTRMLPLNYITKTVPYYKNGLNIIKAGHANGQPNMGVKQGPNVLLDYHNLYRAIESTGTYDDIVVTDTHGGYDNYDHLTIGGDHMIAFDSIAYQLSMHESKRVGVIWIDAHADINTKSTTNSFNKHGMVVSNLMKIDDSIYTHHSFNALLPENIVYVGLRDVEPKEQELIDEFKIENCSSDQIHMSGVYHYLYHALKWTLKDCDHIHVSFDVDVMDPIIFPATGTPVDKGLDYNQVMEITRILKNDHRVKSMDMVEYDPTKDDDRYSCGLMCNDIILSTLTGK